MSIELDELPSSWESACLGDVVEILDHRRIPINSTERSKRLGDVPYFGATGQVGWIDRHIFDEELVLLGEDGAPFLDPAKPKAYLVTGKSWVNNHAHVLRGGSAINNRFLMHQLNLVDYHPFVSGTTRLKLAQAPMKTMRLAIPPLAEQRRIVAEIETQLTRLDAAVAALKRAQANLKRYRAAVLKAAVEGKFTITLTAKSGSSASPTSVSNEMKSVRLGDVLREPLINGRSVRDDPSGFPVLRLTALKHGTVDLGEFKSGAWTYAEASRFLVSKGDFFVARGNGSRSLVGRGGLVESGPEKVAFPDTMIRVRVDESKVSPHYLRLVWDGPQIRSQIERSARTTAGIYKINQRDLEQLTIALPPLAQQISVADEVERRFERLKSASEGFNLAQLRAERLRQSILRKAYSGELVPQDPEDEPASLLLERIRAERAAQQPVKARGSRGRKPAQGRLL